MALSKLTYDSLNVTAAASKAVGFGSGADDLSASLSGGSMVFIKKLTASSSATLSFVDGTSDVVLDSTYKEYMFTFKNIHPEETEKEFGVQFNAAGGSGYNETITSSVIKARHTEGDTAAEVVYNSSADQAQGTGFQTLSEDSGNANDNCVSGFLHLYDPSNTTFVKHFMSTIAEVGGGDSQLKNNFIAGYINTTSAIDEVQFKFSSGDIDAGDICLYGIS
jgi:hypothetical protein